MKVTRRQALVILAGAVGSLLSYGVLNYLRLRREAPRYGVRPGKANPFASAGRSIVSVAEGDVAPEVLVDRAVEGLGGIGKLVEKGDRVVIKPNVGFRYREAVTSPEVTARVVELVQDAGASEVIIAESSVRGSSTMDCYKSTGYDEIAKDLGVELIDLKTEGSLVEVEFADAYRLSRVRTWKELLDSDILISVAKMKRHVDAGVTLGTKNLIGCFPDDEKGRFHRVGLYESIADITGILRPDLVIIDGTTAMVGTGPTGGKMVKLDTIVASGDPLAADYVGAKILLEAEGVEDPVGAVRSIPYFGLIEKLGIGTMDEKMMKVVRQKVE